MKNIFHFYGQDSLNTKKLFLGVFGADHNKFLSWI
jgi:hypothetical protein